MFLGSPNKYWGDLAKGAEVHGHFDEKHNAFRIIEPAIDGIAPRRKLSDKLFKVHPLAVEPEVCSACRGSVVAVLLKVGNHADIAVQLLFDGGRRNEIEQLRAT